MVYYKDSEQFGNALALKAMNCNIFNFNTLYFWFINWTSVRVKVLLTRHLVSPSGEVLSVICVDVNRTDSDLFVDRFQTFNYVPFQYNAGCILDNKNINKSHYSSQVISSKDPNRISSSHQTKTFIKRLSFLPCRTTK